MNKYGIMVVFPRSEIPSAILNDDRNARYGHRGSDSAGDHADKVGQAKNVGILGAQFLEIVNFSAHGIF